MGRSIVSESVVNKLLILIKKLLETPSQRIFKRGFERAVWLIRKTAIKSRVLLSALNNWLRNPDYIFWLGTVQCENQERGQESRYEAIALLRTGDWRECKDFDMW